MKWFYQIISSMILAALVAVPLLPAVRAESASGVSGGGIMTPEYARWLEVRGAQVSGTPVTSAQARQGSPAWTVMVYMAADNNLEPFGMADFNEMEFVGSTETMNVLLQVDRAAQYDASGGDWTDTRRFFVTRDTSLTETRSEQVAALGEANTGDPAALADFVTWAITTYPAQHYALILWDHGGSWQGIATDESAGQDSLTLAELDQALGQAVQATGIEKLDLIGFDACLMGSFEVYRALAPYARYSVGSAELIPGNGWDYLGTLDALAADPSLHGDGLGRAAVDSFMSFYTEVVTQYPIFNLALVDLGQAERVIEGLQGVDAALAGAPETLIEAVIAARSETPVYGAFDDPSFIDVWSAADLLRFMDRLSGATPDAALAGAAGQVFEAGSDMVLYYRSSTEPDVRGGGGVSIYFPRSAKLFAARYPTETPQLDLWHAFLVQLFETARSGVDAAVKGEVGRVSAQAQRAVIEVALGEETQPSKAFAVVSLDLGYNQYIWVDYARLAGQGQQTAEWSGKVAWLTDGYSETPVMVARSERDPNLGIVNGTLYPKNGTPVKVQAVFDLTANTLLNLWGVVPTSSGLLPSEIQGQPGDIFHADWLSDGPKGSTVISPASVQLVLSDQPLQLVWKAAPQGAYRIVLHVQDTAGAISRDSLDLAVTESSDEAFDLQEIDLASEDIDADGVPNDEDNCAAVANPDQEDYDEDGIGDACDLFDDLDLDGDGIDEAEDNCPSVYNPDQADEDGDGVGDACAAYSDEDWDGIPDDMDLCPGVYDAAQSDLDGDGIGDVCDESTEEFDLDDDYSWEETESEDEWYEEEWEDDWGDEESEDEWSEEESEDEWTDGESEEELSEEESEEEWIEEGTEEEWAGEEVEDVPLEEEGDVIEEDPGGADAGDAGGGEE